MLGFHSRRYDGEEAALVIFLCMGICTILATASCLIWGTLKVGAVSALCMAIGGGMIGALVGAGFGFLLVLWFFE